MQPIFILATIVALSTLSLIAAGDFLVRKLASQLEATTRQLSSALADHARVGERLLSAVDGLPTIANVAKFTKHPMTGAQRTEHSHVVTFTKE